ncbi:gastrula zinc finger protein XlCGF57.1-like [Cydia fagiglandana]|uniref:gastrula zinc finger protein XlCGF57.1-like n=1 Tax=Cydia fagiglandana TaxID=1458189 RepID=UPI002FEE1196
MNDSDKSHCRLCAEIKPIEKLIHLESDIVRRLDIVKKLTRVNANSTIVFERDVLPKTVCIICINSLDKAFEFVEKVEHAQQVLINTYKNVKKEEFITDDDYTELLTPETIIKEEPAVLVDNSAKVSKKPVKKRVQKPQLTWKDYKWTCAKCGSEFTTIEEFKTHSMTYHECCNAFKCTDCNTNILRLDKFILHVKRHRKHLKLSCYICNTKFSSGNKVTLHKKVHSILENVCSGCNSEFQNVDDLNQHIKLYYKNRAGSTIAVMDTSDGLTCVICKKTFKNKGSLNGHLLVHTQKSPKKRAHICDRCGKGFYNKSDLAAHVASHEEARPFQCEICKADFKTVIRLKAHIKLHNDFKPYSCIQCFRRFRLRKQLKSHEIIHTDSLPFVCPYCSKAFRFKSILDLHLRQHTGVKPYCCELCQRNFTNWSNYNKHMKRRHGTSMAKRKPNIIVENTPVTGMDYAALPEKTLHVMNT